MLKKMVNRFLKGALLVLAIAVSAPVLAGDILNGRILYNDNCTGCHGASGKGDDFGVPAFSEGSLPTAMDTDIVPIIENGQGIMPAFMGLLTDQEILDVISYIRTMDE